MLEGDASRAWRNSWLRWRDADRTGGRFFRAGLILAGGGDIHTAIGILKAFPSVDDACRTAGIDVLSTRASAAIARAVHFVLR